MAFKEDRGIIGRTWDFVGSAAVVAAGTFAATAVGATIFSLGYVLGGAAGLGGFLSAVTGVIATCVAAAPVIWGGIILGGVATTAATVAGAALGMRSNGWGVTAGVGLGLAATFSMISNLTSREPEVDSMLNSVEPYSVAEMDESKSVLSESFAGADKQIIAANDQFFTVGAPRLQL